MFRHIIGGSTSHVKRLPIPILPRGFSRIHHTASNFLHPRYASDVSFPNLTRENLKTRSFHSTRCSQQDSKDETLFSRVSRRLLYKKDGTSRSKTTGLFITALSTTLLLILIPTIPQIRDLLHINLTLITVLQIQHLDHQQYTHVDWGDWGETMEYLNGVVRALVEGGGGGLLTREDVEVVWGVVRELGGVDVGGGGGGGGGDGESNMDSDSESHSTDADSEAPKLKSRIHKKSKQTADRIHILLSGTKKEPYEASQEIVRVVRETLVGIVEELRGASVSSEVGVSGGKEDSLEVILDHLREDEEDAKARVESIREREREKEEEF